MGVNSKIEWTDHTFNPWIGCTKVSAGCANCYAEALMDKRYGTAQWGPQGTRKRTSPVNWRKPLQWNRQRRHECPSCGWRGDLGTVYKACPVCDRLYPNPSRQRIFCASLADVFEDRPELVEWRRDLVVMMEQTPNLDWLLLTKRPENVNRMIADTLTIDPTTWWQSMRNVWIGTSVENQEQADKRIPELLNIPAHVRFLSMEPLLGPVDLGPDLYFNGVHKGEIFYNRIDWVIVGGESGPNARPMHPDWVRSIRDQCQAAGVPFHFKQWGEWLPVGRQFDDGIYHWPGDDLDIIKKHPHVFMDINGSFQDCTDCRRRGFSKVGKKTAGRLLDGVEWSESPQ